MDLFRIERAYSLCHEEMETLKDLLSEAHLESSHVPGVTPWECIYISNRATQSQEICPWIAVSKWQTHFILTQNIYSTLLINHIGTSSCTTQNRSVNTFSKTQIYKRIKWTKVIIFSLWNLTKYRWGNFSLENCWIFFMQKHSQIWLT